MTRGVMLICAAALLAASGCGSKSPDDVATLRVGVLDPLCIRTKSTCVATEAKRDYETLVEPLRADGIAVTFSYFMSDDDLADALASGKVDAVVTKAWTLARIEHGRDVAFERLADLARPDGRAELAGAFVVRIDSPIETLDDLNGKTMAFGSVPGGYEKSIQAREMLAAAGINVTPKDVLDRCPEVLSAVYEREVDAGVVSDYVADLGGFDMIDADGFRVIARTEGIPFITFAVAETVPESSRERLRASLLRITGKKAPAGLHSTGFVAPMTWTPRFEETP